MPFKSYIEAYLEGTELDEPLRDVFAKELLSYFESAVAEGISHGMSLEDAERQVILNQNNPIPRSFWLKHAARRRISFLYLAINLAIILTSMIAFAKIFDACPFDFVNAHKHLLLAALAVFLSCGFVLSWIEDRFSRPPILIKGNCLQVWRWGFMRTQIPFTEIVEVCFQSGHILGTHNLVIQHQKGKYLLQASSPGFLLAALALRSFARDRLTPEVAEHLQKIKIKLKKGFSCSKTILCVTWVMALILWGISFADLWSGRGVPWIALGALGLNTLLPIPWILNQAKKFDQAKGALLWNLSLCALFWMDAGFLAQKQTYTQWALIVFVLGAIMGLSAIWWNGNWRVFFVTAGVGLLLMALAAAFVPGDRWIKKEVLFEGKGFSSCFQWLRDGQGAAYIDSEPCASLKNARKAVLHVLISDEERRSLDLPPDWWGFFPMREKDAIGLISINTTCSKSLPLLCLRNFKDLEIIRNLPDCWCIGGRILAHQEIWSLDSKYLLHAKCDQTTSQGRRRLAKYEAYNMRGCSDIPLEGEGQFFNEHWLDEERFEALAIKFPSDAEDKATTTKHIEAEAREYTASTGAYRSIWRNSIDYRSTLPIIEWSFSCLEQSSLALIQECSAANHQPTDTVALFLVNLRNSEREPLGNCQVQDMYYEWQWNPQRQILTFWRRTNEKSGSKDLIIYSPGRGVVGQKSFPSDEIVSALRLAPDGTKILYLHHSASRRYIIGGLIQPEIWDFASGATQQPCFLGSVQGMLANTVSGSISAFAPLQWSPDSKSFVIPIMTSMNTKGDAKYSFTRVWLESKDAVRQ